MSDENQPPPHYDNPAAYRSGGEMDLKSAARRLLEDAQSELDLMTEPAVVGYQEGATNRCWWNEIDVTSVSQRLDANPPMPVIEEDPSTSSPEMSASTPDVPDPSSPPMGQLWYRRRHERPPLQGHGGQRDVMPSPFQRMTNIMPAFHGPPLPETLYQPCRVHLPQRTVMSPKSKIRVDPDRMPVSVSEAPPYQPYARDHGVDYRSLQEGPMARKKDPAWCCFQW